MSFSPSRLLLPLSIVVLVAAPGNRSRWSPWKTPTTVRR